MERESRWSGRMQLTGWNVVLVLNKTSSFKGSCAADEYFYLAVHGSPSNMWKDTGQEGIDFGWERSVKASSLVVVPNSLYVFNATLCIFCSSPCCNWR